MSQTVLELKEDGEIGKSDDDDSTHYVNKEPLHPLYVQDYKVHSYQSGGASDTVTVVKTVTINSMGTSVLPRGNFFF